MTRSMTFFLNLIVMAVLVGSVSCRARKDVNSSQLESDSLSHESYPGGTDWKAGNGKALLPIGINLAVFNKIVRIFKEEQRTSKFEAMVLYGSRVNFEFGNKPKKDSDLDIVVFFPDNTDPMAIFDFQTRLNKKFEDITRLTQFQIEEQLPSMLSFTEAIQEKSVLSKRSMAEDKRIWEELLKDAKKYNWSDQELKEKYMNARQGGSVGKQALFLLPDNAESRRKAGLLAKIDYKNIVYVSI